MRNKEYYTVKGLTSSQFKTYAQALSGANGDNSKVIFPEDESVLEVLKMPKESKKKSKSNQSITNI